MPYTPDEDDCVIGCLPGHLLTTEEAEPGSTLQNCQNCDVPIWTGPSTINGVLRVHPNKPIVFLCITCMITMMQAQGMGIDQIEALPESIEVVNRMLKGEGDSKK